MAPWPPPSPSTAIRLPRIRSGCISAWARSIICVGVDTRCAPAARQAASTTAAELTSAPVCEAAARVLASPKPTVISTTGLPAAAAASTKARPSRKSST